MGAPDALTLADWALLPEVWVIIAFALVGADLVFGLDFFVLSIGVAALVVAGLLLTQRNLWFGDFVLFETWRGVFVWFAGLSVSSTVAIRLLLRQHRRNLPDINEY